MNARSGQIAIVLILGAALLIYGGATGRLADAWKGLTGGGGGGSTTTTTTPPTDQATDDGSVGAEPMDSTSPRLQAVRSSALNGQLVARPGGVL